MIALHGTTEAPKVYYKVVDAYWTRTTSVVCYHGNAAGCRAEV